MCLDLQRNHSEAIVQWRVHSHGYVSSTSNVRNNAHGKCKRHLSYQDVNIMSGHKLCKLSKQQETTWAKLHRRLIGLDFNYEELFSKDVSSFIADNAKATSSSIRYFIAPLLTTVNYLVSRRSLPNISESKDRFESNFYETNGIK